MNKGLEKILVYRKTNVTKPITPFILEHSPNFFAQFNQSVERLNGAWI